MYAAHLDVSVLQYVTVNMFKLCLHIHIPPRYDSNVTMPTANKTYSTPHSNFIDMCIMRLDVSVLQWVAVGCRVQMS